MAASATNFWYIEAESNGTLAQFPKRSTPPGGKVGAKINSRQQQHHHLGKRADFPAATIDALIEAYQQYFNLSATESLYTTIPNPFAGMSSGTAGDVVEPASIQLADGSESGQSIPYWPLIQPARKADFM